MAKYVTTYKPNPDGQIEKIETIDGVVVDEEKTPPKNAWSNTWSYFYSRGASSTDGNGREFNPDSDNWEYTTERNGNANPCQCDYEAPQDGQGSVPILL